MTPDQIHKAAHILRQVERAQALRKLIHDADGNLSLTLTSGRGGSLALHSNEKGLFGRIVLRAKNGLLDDLIEFENDAAMSLKTLGVTALDPSAPVVPLPGEPEDEFKS